MIKVVATLILSTFITLSFAEECKKTKVCPSTDKKKCAEYQKKDEKCKSEYEACKKKCKGDEECIKKCKEECKIKCSSKKNDSIEKSTKSQSKCPVMGGAVEIGKSKYVDVKGKRIYICCSGCEAPIKKDPDKFIKQLEDDGVKLEVIPN